MLVGDAFSARSVPWHLATVEFAREIRRVLRPGGVYALNLIDQPPLKLLRAEAATLLAVFGDVALVAGRAATRGGNFVLLASETSLPAEAASTSRGARTSTATRSPASPPAPTACATSTRPPTSSYRDADRHVLNTQLFSTNGNRWA